MYFGFIILTGSVFVFIVFLLQSYGAVLAASDFYQEVDRTQGSNTDPTNNNDGDSGYSAGNRQHTTLKNAKKFEIHFTGKTTLF